MIFFLIEYGLSADGKGVPNFKPSNPHSAAMKTPQIQPQCPVPPQRKNLKMEMEEKEDSNADDDGSNQVCITSRGSHGYAVL